MNQTISLPDGSKVLLTGNDRHFPDSSPVIHKASGRSGWVFFDVDQLNEIVRTRCYPVLLDGARVGEWFHESDLTAA